LAWWKCRFRILPQKGQIIENSDSITALQYGQKKSFRDIIYLHNLVYTQFLFQNDFFLKIFLLHVSYLISLQPIMNYLFFIVAKYKKNELLKIRFFMTFLRHFMTFLRHF